ncbi:MAG: bacteriophage CI repressor, partial [Candidatus Dadabacteria bacterium]
MRKTVEEIIDIIKHLKRFTTDYEVADSLGVGRSALSNAKRRDSLSFIDELVMFCDRESLSLDFIRIDPPACESALKKVAAPSGIPHGETD